MRNKVLFLVRNVSEIVFSDAFQAILLIVVFGVFGLVCLVCSFWNEFLLVFAVMCAIMVLCGISEYKKARRK